jgi:hypothetical protein
MTNHPKHTPVAATPAVVSHKVDGAPCRHAASFAGFGQRAATAGSTSSISRRV